MKNLSKLLFTTTALLLMQSSFAVEIIDVNMNHWASAEIVRSIQNGFISIVDGNKFKPESFMPRNEFVTSLLKVIGRQNESVVEKTTYKDINTKTKNARNVVLSEQIRMSYGYPDKTFKPLTDINHNETMSMIANITNADYVVSDISKFDDYQEIPTWARRAYIKNVANGIYVNYPDEKKFKPSNKLTRAEAAVLFDRLLNNLDKVKDSYRDMADDMNNSDANLGYAQYDDFNYVNSKYLGDNTLNLADFARNNKVKIYDNKRIIEAGNILIGTDLRLVKTRKDLVGHEYVFVAPNDVYTKEGTFLYPKGTEFYARVDKIGYSAWRSKPERSRIVFHKYSFPTGETYDMAGVPYTKDDKIVYANAINKKLNNMKNLTYNGSTKGDKIIKYAHQRAPLTEYNIDNGKTIYILITGDTVIPLDETYFNLRTEKSLLEQDKI